MKIKPHLFFLLIFCLSGLHVQSQEQDSLYLQPYRIGVTGYYGFLINHSPRIVPMNQQHAFGGELFFSKQTHGENSWNRFFNYPEYGLSYTVMSVGSPDYAGTAQSLIPFMNFHLFSNRNPFNLNLRVGVGAGYLPKVFDEDSNPLSQASGSHLNYALNLQFQGTYRIDNHWNLYAGAGLYHLSNGAFKMPNYGLNVVSALAGVNYAFGGEELAGQKQFPEYSKKWQPAIFLTGGMKEILSNYGHKYFTGGGYFELSRQHLACTRYSGILDITYDQSVYRTVADNRWEAFKLGVGVGYSLIFNRLSLNLNGGVYLYEKDKTLGIIYQRSAIRYFLSDAWCVQIALRNQLGTADFVEFGIGFLL